MPGAEDIVAPRRPIKAAFRVLGMRSISRSTSQPQSFAISATHSTRDAYVDAALLLSFGGGARNLAPLKSWLQHGIAINGHPDSAARRGVHGVSSSAWFEMTNVPLG